MTSSSKYNPCGHVDSMTSTILNSKYLSTVLLVFNYLVLFNAHTVELRDVNLTATAIPMFDQNHSI